MMKNAVFTLLVVVTYTEANMQNVTVKGTVICDKHRMNNVIVELWEKDTLSNDKLASMHTGVVGDFYLTGGDSEITTITPYVKFKHTCKAPVKEGHKCWRKTKYDVPAEYIFTEKTKETRKVYDMTFVSLDIFSADDEEHCEKIK